jgi:[ribosomal protein S5]-alanine N-acetyltransferase
VILTERLALEPLGPEHVAGLARILGDPRVGATLGGVQDEAWVRKHVASVQQAWARDGVNWWAALDRSTGELVGRGGLNRKVIDDAEELEAGWTVAPERWGQGLATEIGAAAVAYARERGRANLISITLPHNVASRRIMEKLDFAYERDIEYAGLPHVLYRKTL